MYYPLSQIITDLYTNGSEFTTNPNTINNTSESYIGYYWKTSTGRFFTGKTPQDTPIRRLYPFSSSLLSIDVSSNKNLITINYLLEEIFPEDATINSTLSSYTKVSNNNDLQYPILSPYYSITYPTDKNYQIGEFKRFFCKKINEIVYLEINENTYSLLAKKDSKIAYQYYQPFNITWTLTGDREQVYKTNKNIVELTIKQQKLPQFDKYLKEDYTKYYL